MHGDDYVSAGPDKSLQWLKEQMEKVYECKRSVVGPEDRDAEAVKVLTRIITWHDHGGTFEADPRHAERSLVARANYLALDRADFEFACKELSSKMARPSKGDWEGLKRLGRYLKGAPRIVHPLPWKPNLNGMIAYSDANCAGDKATRKSTSGGAMRVGNHTLNTWSKTQAVLPLSSAESALYDPIETTAEALGMQSFLK